MDHEKWKLQARNDLMKDFEDLKKKQTKEQDLILSRVSFVYFNSIAKGHSRLTVLYAAVQRFAIWITVGGTYSSPTAVGQCIPAVKIP